MSQFLTPLGQSSVAETNSMGLNFFCYFGLGGPHWKIGKLGGGLLLWGRAPQELSLSLSFAWVWCWGCAAWLTNRLTLQDGFGTPGAHVSLRGLLGECGCAWGAPKFRRECQRHQTSTMPWRLLRTLFHLYPITNSCYQSGALFSQMKQRWRSELRGFPRPARPGTPKHTIFLRGGGGPRDFQPRCDHFQTIFRPFSDRFQIIFRPFSDHFLRPFSDHFQTIFRPFSDHFQTIFRPSDHFQTIFGPFSDHFQTISRPFFSVGPLFVRVPLQFLLRAWTDQPPTSKIPLRGRVCFST